MTEGPVAGPSPPGLVAGLGHECPAGGLHEPAERHRRGAGRLAALALHAEVHEPDEGVVEGCPLLHGAHGCDPAAG